MSNSNLFDQTAIEQANSFLQQIIFPPLDQTNLVLSDQFKVFKSDNVMNVVLKAEKIIERKRVKVKKLPLKILNGLMQNAALEEEPSLQDKWAMLLANTVDQSSQLEHSLFAYSLSQLTKADADFFTFVCKQCTTVQKEEEKDFEISACINNRALNTKGLDKLFPQIALSVDNLLRLRLVKELQNDRLSLPVIILTDLGFQFMLALGLPYEFCVV